MTSRATGSLADQVALVTGATSGIGLATAHRLAAEGARVAVVASASLRRASDAVDAIEEAGGRAVPFVADVSEPAQVRALVDDVVRLLGVPDIVVNSAGVWYENPLEEVPRAAGSHVGVDGLDDGLDRMVDVNLKGVVRVTTAVAPLMVRRGSGHVVNIASAAGIVASPGYSLYAATKAGVIAFTRAAALELAPEGVAINAIAPGNTATPMNEHVRADPDPAGRLDWVRRTTPSRRLFTPAAEIAEAVLVLVDGRINGFHGAVLTIDEGRTAGVTARAG